jgi:hypothetical protein
MERAMIVILGLIILIGAVIVGVAGVLANGGSTHELTHGFSVFGYHVTGSTGTLFLYGIVVGALALFGLSLLLAGVRHTSRRGRATRRELQQSRRETAAASRARDDLIDQRDNARAATASAAAGAHSNGAQSNGAQAGGAHAGGAQSNGAQSNGAQSNGAQSRGARQVSSDDGPLGRLRRFGRPSAPRQVTVDDSPSRGRRPAAGVVHDAPALDVPAGASAPAEAGSKIKDTFKH